MAGAGEDTEVLSYAYALEQVTQARAEPNYYRDAYDVPELVKALEP